MKNHLFIISFSCLILFSGCSGCSKPAQKIKLSNHSISSHHLSSTEEQISSSTEEQSISPKEKTTIQMEKVNGVYEIPTEIDNIPMHFIFDTGAGLISISETEASFLYKQGKLTQDYIIGSANFIDANGTISEGTIINLKTVKLGNRVLKNVEASVVHNLGAPLLMGQSALEKFGKFFIDYQRGEITFQ
jgi:aspartyl protease family protein